MPHLVCKKVERMRRQTYADVIVSGVVGNVGTLAVGGVEIRFLQLLIVHKNRIMLQRLSDKRTFPRSAPSR